LAKTQQTISVALCTYNGQQFLHKQLASIASQTRLPDEVVACDDRSTDQTREVLRDFAASVSFPVRIIENEHNLGSAKNFEKAIALCSGAFIALCDQDDTWYPHRLERCEQELLAHPEAGLVFSDGVIVDDQDHPVGQQLWQAFSLSEAHRVGLQSGRYDLLLRYRFVTGATIMFRSVQRDRCFPFPAQYIHDEWLAAVLAVFCDLRAIEQPLICYRRHSFQQVGSPAGAVPRWSIQKHWDTLAEGEQADTYWRHLRRYVNFGRAVCDAVSQEPLDARGQSVLSSYQSWLSFASFRLQLPRPRYRRVAPILKNYPGYARHARGLQSAAKDLLRSQPQPPYAPS
jgi:glycosyltransferase involved in cell wall biosynthesis